jgi:uncharacterized membrane protein (UPF0127 family)
MTRSVDPLGRQDAVESFTVRNVATGAVLASFARVADTSTARRQGLLRFGSMGRGEGLWIVPCEAIHTFRMKFSIDAVFVDRGHRVRKICPRLSPWRVAGCLRADSVLERPAGVLSDSATAVGHHLEFVANRGVNG